MISIEVAQAEDRVEPAQDSSRYMYCEDRVLDRLGGKGLQG